jgi:hypothetical protein
MKGIVFTEFMEMLEAQHSQDVVEEVLDRVDLPSQGAYTSVGTYDSSEMVALVVETSAQTGIPVPELLRTFGHHLFGRFVGLFPVFFENMTTSLEFLPTVHSFVHLEVQKLYEDAELPTFETESSAPGHITMTYRSSRNLPDLAQGLIEASIAHFGDALTVHRAAHGTDPGAVVFTLSPSA